MFCVVFWRNIRRQSRRYDHYACLLLLFIVTLLVLLFLLSDNCEKRPLTTIFLLIYRSALHYLYKADSIRTKRNISRSHATLGIILLSCRPLISELTLSYCIHNCLLFLLTFDVVPSCVLTYWKFDWLAVRRLEFSLRAMSTCLQEIFRDNLWMDCRAIGNESVPIQLAQCWFTGLAISSAKI